MYRIQEYCILVRGCLLIQIQLLVAMEWLDLVMVLVRDGTSPL